MSKALNGRGQLRAETRERVLAAAAQLGFRPSPLARGLLSGRSYTVGLITTDSFGRFTIPVMLGAEDALGEGQMSVLLCDGRGDPIREQHYVRTLLSRKVDGIIVTGRRTDPRPPIASGLPVPVVYVMTQSDNPDDLSLIPDDANGGELAVRHLVTSGRTRIAHVTGPERFLSARLRASGTRKVLAEAGLDLAGGQVLYGEWTEEWGRQGAHAVLRSDPRTEAIFCGSDQIARGVADALRESGRRVPDDIALVGYDNWDVFAETSRPPPDHRGHVPQGTRPARGAPAARRHRGRPVPWARTASLPSGHPRVLRRVPPRWAGAHPRFPPSSRGQEARRGRFIMIPGRRFACL